MKLTDDIMDDLNPREISPHGVVHPPMPRISGWDDKRVENCMIEYGKAILDELMQNASTYIYIDDGEAVFSYGAMEELKKNLL